MFETPMAFVRAVEERTGLEISEIPDADMDIPLSGGVLIINSQFGELWFFEFSHKGDNNEDIYQFACIVSRVPEVPAAKESARGDMLAKLERPQQGQLV